MRIFLHDYAGHPFQVGLSRAFVKLGHQVTHAYFAGDPGPKGAFSVEDGDRRNLLFEGVKINGAYSKASLLSRRFKDIEYGRNVRAQILAQKPDVVLSGNTPTEAQTWVLQGTKEVGAGFVHWVQDFYSVAASRILAKRLGPVGAAVGAYYRWVERRQFEESDAIVIITEAFRSTAESWVTDKTKIYTIENWGAIDDITPRPKYNDWSIRHGVQNNFVFLYSGTLALKHNPEFLLALARFWKNDPEVRVVVVGQGVGYDKLCAAREGAALDNLVLLPLQPVHELPNVLASSDVLVAVVEPDAGAFSVPSKVQSYLCAERPILLAAPAENLASGVVLRERAGLVVEPNDCDAFLSCAQMLRDNASVRNVLARNGLAYARKTYSVDNVAQKFLDVMQRICRKNPLSADTATPQPQSALPPAIRGD